MPPSVTTLIRICLFKAKPQDLPASFNLLVAAAFAALILFTIRNYLLSSSVDVITISLVQVVLLGLGLKLLLVLFSKPERWIQSATALFGCSALILLTMMPIIIFSGGGDINGEINSFLKYAIIAASIWYFLLFVFIFRETLEISNALAFVIALVLELSFATILISLFGNQLL